MTRRRPRHSPSFTLPPLAVVLAPARARVVTRLHGTVVRARHHGWSTRIQKKNKKPPITLVVPVASQTKAEWAAAADGQPALAS